MAEIGPVRQAPPTPATARIDSREKPREDKKDQKRDNEKQPPPTPRIDEYA
jgi:hypothetical protein